VERWLHKFVLRCRSLFQWSRVERELDEELRFHIDRQVEQLVARGAAPDEARRAAVIALGGVEQQREACRDARHTEWIDHTWRDVRYAMRVLRASPGFTIVAILSLALGIGANTAIFQLIDAIRLRHLPVPRAEELADVRIAGGNGGWGVSENANSQLTYPLWEQIRVHQQAFSGIFAWGTTPFLVGTGPDARVVGGLWVSGEAFRELGVTPALGRLLGPDDDVRGCPPVVVLNYAFWETQFGGDPGAVGRTLTVLDRPVAVVGVTSPEFFGLEVGKRFDIALPICAAATWGSPLDRRDWFWLSATGRLNRGWTVERAADHMRALSPGLLQATLPSGRDASGLERYRSFRLTVVPAANGVSELRAAYGRALWVLLAMTGLVLLMACVNLMNLLLARASAREQEIAVRVAIGASRRRVMLQLLIESLLLAGCGAFLGAAIARPLSGGILALLTTERNPLHLDLRPDWLVLAFTAAAGIFTCVAFGVLPAFRASHVEPGMAIKAGGRGLTGSRERARIQRGLLVAQVAVSFVLIVGAALFVRSFRNLITFDTGFKRDGVIFARVADFSDRPSPERIFAAQSELLDRIRSVPQVVSAATTTKVPLDGSSWTLGFVLPASNDLKRHSSKFTFVSPQYFTTVGMRLVTGRDFNSGDTAKSRRVTLVNQTFVRRYLSGNPIGTMLRTVAEPGYPETLYEVIGVVSDTEYSSLREPIQPITFVPIAQHPSLRPWPNIVIRSLGPPAVVIAAVKRAIAELRPNMASGFTVLENQVREGLLPERLLAWLAGGFGILAALLAATGVYGVIAYLVARRRHEIAVRLALGAGRTRVIRLVLGEMGVLLAIGLACGVAVATAAARGANALLFGVTPRDPAMFLAAPGVLVVIALVASSIPALRASRVDATAALRSE
jgi:predicted permease